MSIRRLSAWYSLVQRTPQLSSGDLLDNQHRLVIQQTGSLTKLFNGREN
jgi:hemin uptake protein HemP